VDFLLVLIELSGGLARRKTGRFPGKPLLPVFRAPGRTREFISLIINWQSADRLSIQRTGHDVRRVSPSEQTTVMYLIHSPVGYRLPESKLFLMRTIKKKCCRFLRP